MFEYILNYAVVDPGMGVLLIGLCKILNPHLFLREIHKDICWHNAMLLVIWDVMKQPCPKLDPAFSHPVESRMTIRLAADFRGLNTRKPSIPTKGSFNLPVSSKD